MYNNIFILKSSIVIICKNWYFNQSGYPNSKSNHNETSLWSYTMELPGHNKVVLCEGYKTT